MLLFGALVCWLACRDCLRDTVLDGHTCFPVCVLGGWMDGWMDGSETWFFVLVWSIPFSALFTMPTGGPSPLWHHSAGPASSNILASHTTHTHTHTSGTTAPGPASSMILAASYIYI